MASSLFPRRNNTVLGAIQAMQGASGGNPNALFNHLYQSNPQFRSFADSVKDKSPEIAFSQYGLDFNQVRSMLR